MGVKSRREKPIGPRIVDFVAVELALIIELDGGQHAAQETADAARTAVLEHEGFKVLRLWNDEVLARTDVVLEQIRMAVASSETLSPNPSPASGRGEIKVRN
jgi:adenine-specific DNA-methyltransferase